MGKTVGCFFPGHFYRRMSVYQRRGDPCAAKIFTAGESAASGKGRVRQNEIDFMRMLDHTNIVRFYAIEHEACYVTLLCTLFKFLNIFCFLS